MTECPSGADPKSCGVDPKSCPGCDPAHHEEQQTNEERELQRSLKQIRHKLVVMSGKGGVGKSSVAVALALGLARRGHKVGLMDVDLHGPNVLRMLGLKDPLDLLHAQFPLPPDLFDHLRVVSIEMLMRDREMAVIWRGPLKHQLIRQFLTEVQWDALDYLVVDCPPGTGDEPMSVAQTIPDAKAVIVTTPQEISLADVRKSINFCRKINLEILGIVENMSGYHCPHCAKELPLFKSGGGAKTAQAAKVPFLGALPFDPNVVEAADQGQLLEVKEDGERLLPGPAAHSGLPAGDPAPHPDGQTGAGSNEVRPAGGRRQTLGQIRPRLPFRHFSGAGRQHRAQGTGPHAAPPARGHSRMAGRA